MEAFYYSKKPLQVLGCSLAWLGSDFGWCLGQMRPLPIYRHQGNALEPWRVPLQIKNILECPRLFYVQAYIQEYIRDS